jgi:hypothetical protein
VTEPPRVVGPRKRRDAERPRLEDLEAVVAERPLDLHRRADERFGREHQPAQLLRLGLRETRRRDQRGVDRLGPGAGVARAGDQAVLDPGLESHQ